MIPAPGTAGADPASIATENITGNVTGNITETAAGMTSEKAAEIAAAIAAWFARAGRRLPWREGYEPYRVWISEIMLQQTRVETVVPYFQRWMERFADVAAVAAASREEVLKAWEGLGYYGRARNLHRAARDMVARHGGQVPAHLAELLALPGIGRYTAGAIASIAHGQPAPIVDGNVGRVLGRLFAMRTPIRSPRGQSFLWAAATALVNRGPPRAVNEGLMELGALVCLPRTPQCIAGNGTACPLRSHCAARDSGDPERYPPPLPRKQRPVRKGAMILLGDARGRMLLRKRPPDGLWGGLWEPPWLELEGKMSRAQALRGARKWLEEMGWEVDSLFPLGELSHGLTHFQLRLQCFSARGMKRKGRGRLPSGLRWVEPGGVASLPISRLGRRGLEMAAAHEQGNS